MCILCQVELIAWPCATIASLLVGGRSSIHFIYTLLVVPCALMSTTQLLSYSFAHNIVLKFGQKKMISV